MIGRRLRRQNQRQIFAVPFLIGCLSIAGLLAALVGDGIWDGASWLALGVPAVLPLLIILRPHVHAGRPRVAKPQPDQL